MAPKLTYLIVHYIEITLKPVSMNLMNRLSLTISTIIIKENVFNCMDVEIYSPHNRILHVPASKFN